MAVLLTCQNEEDPIKMFFQSVNINIAFRHSWVANSAARDGIGPKFELIETSMDVLVTYMHARMKKTKTKLKALEC